MEQYCATGQSPQRAVASMEEEEEEEEYRRDSEYRSSWFTNSQPHKLEEPNWTNNS